MTEQVEQTTEEINEQQTEQAEQGGGQESTPEQTTGQSTEQTTEQAQSSSSQQQEDWRDKEIRRLRDGEARYRTERNQEREHNENFKKAVAKALGIDTGEEALDPEKLQGDLQQERNESRNAKTQLAFYKAASKHNADADLAWAHLYANGVFEGLDPASEDFSEKVEQSVQAALETYPKLKADYTPPTQNVGGGSNPAADTQEVLPEVNPWSTEHFNLTEQARVLRETPDLARRLQNAAKA